MTPGPTSRPLVIEGELTVQVAATVKQELIDHLADAPEVVLDVSRVSEVDTAGLQLLLLAKREAAAAGVPFVLAASSSAVREVLALAGLEDDLQDIPPAGLASGASNS